MKTFLSITLGLVLVAILSLWLIAPRIIIPEVKNRLNSYGFENVDAQGAMLGLGAASLDQLSFERGGEDFSFKNVRIFWDGLIPQGINKIAIEDTTLPFYPTRPDAPFGFQLDPFINKIQCDKSASDKACPAPGQFPNIHIENATIKTHFKSRVFDILAQDIGIIKEGNDIRFAGELTTDEADISGRIKFAGFFENQQNYQVNLSARAFDFQQKESVLQQISNASGQLKVTPQNVTGKIAIPKLSFEQGAVENVKIDIAGDPQNNLQIDFTDETLSESSRLEGEATINIKNKTAVGQYLFVSSDLSKFGQAYPELNKTMMAGRLNVIGEFDLIYQKGFGGTITANANLNKVDFQNFTNINGDVKAQYEIEGKTLNTQINLSSQSPDVIAKTSLTLNQLLDDGSIDITGDIERIKINDISLSARKITAHFIPKSDQTTFDLTEAEIKFYGSLAQLPSLSGHLQGSYSQPKVNFSFDGTGMNGRIAFDAAGEYVTDTQRFSMDYDLDPLALFTAENLHKVFPQTQNIIEAFSGSIKAAGTVNYVQKTLSTEQVVKIDANSATVNGIEMSGIASVLKVKTTPEIRINDEEVYIGKINIGGLPFTDNTVVFSYNSGTDEISVHDNMFHLAGGELTTTPFTYNTKAQNASFTVNAKQLGLNTIFTAVPVDGLSATGSISGKVPIKIENGRVFVTNGHLEANGDGEIQYQPDELPKLFQQDNMYVDLVREALRDYNYSILTLDINLEGEENQHVLLKARGSNPDFFDGRPVEVNLNLEGELKDLLRFNVGAYQLPERIKKQMNELRD